MPPTAPHVPASVIESAIPVHSAGWDLYRHTYRCGRRRPVSGTFFAPDAETARDYAERTLDPDGVTVSVERVSR